MTSRSSDEWQHLIDTQQASYVTKNRAKTTIDISHLSIDQLYALNVYVSGRIDELEKQQDKEALSLLRLGMKVQFSDNGIIITGVLLKKNRKTAVVANNN